MNVMLGYYKNPEATKAVMLPDGWLRTGDLGTLDKDGFLYIRGRSKSMILSSNGQNIYPEEIENVLNSHALVNDSLVREDNMGKLVAIVYFNREELERKYKTMKEELGIRMENIKHELLAYVNSKISTVIEQKDEFEKTPTHKIKRFLYNKKQK